jgi:UDP-N-acetylglucosamine 2-epimerase (non-hydrolysing)
VGAGLRKNNMAKKKVKILTIFGTRKELIKVYPVLEKLAAADNIESIVVTTSQHPEAFEDLYALFNINPDHDLNLKRDRAQLSDITNLALAGIEPLLKYHKPDLVLVQGESTTAFSGALAAFYNKIPVGHIGAGERTFIKTDPYPEEVNRRLASSLSDLHFVFNAKNVEYLIHEGAIPRNVFITGSTLIDAILAIARRKRKTLVKHISPDDLNTFKTIVVTAHKKENWGKPLQNLCAALIDLTRAYPDVQIAFPLKFTSEVRDTAFKLLKNKERIHLLDQLPFEAFVEAMARSIMIITDSDCIKEEGLALKKPVLVFGEGQGPAADRQIKGVKAVGAKTEGIVVEASGLIEDRAAYQRMVAEHSPFGDGRAAERIVQAVRSHFSLGERPADFKPQAKAELVAGPKSKAAKAQAVSPGASLH